MYARFTMIGRISTELKKRKGTNSDFISFSVAVDRPYKDENGKRPTDFYSCTANGNIMELLIKYAKKGDLIFLSGRPQVNKWLDAEDNAKAMVVVNIQNVEFIQGKKGSEVSKNEEDFSESSECYMNNDEFDYQN